MPAFARARFRIPETRLAFSAQRASTARRTPAKRQCQSHETHFHVLSPARGTYTIPQPTCVQTLAFLVQLETISAKILWCDSAGSEKKSSLTWQCPSGHKSFPSAQSIAGARNIAIAPRSLLANKRRFMALSVAWFSSANDRRDARPAAPRVSVKIPGMRIARVLGKFAHPPALRMAALAADTGIQGFTRGCGPVGREEIVDIFPPELLHEESLTSLSPISPAIPTLLSRTMPSLVYASELALVSVPPTPGPGRNTPGKTDLCPRKNIALS